MVDDKKEEKKTGFAQLVVAEVAGVIGVLCLSRNENGRLLSAAFNPLTQTLFSSLGLGELGKYKRQWNASFKEAQNLLSSGVLYDPKWLADHVVIAGQDINHMKLQEYKVVKDALEAQLKTVSGRQRLARAFAQAAGDRVTFVVTELPDGVYGSTCSFLNRIELNKKYFDAAKDLAHITKETIPHEIKHLAQKRVPPSLNAREYGVWSGIIAEADARAAVQMNIYHTFREYLQHADVSKFSEKAKGTLQNLLRQGRADCTLDKFIALHKTDRQAFNKIFDQCASRTYEEFFKEAVINQACSVGYITQMLAGADNKGKGNLKALEAWVDEMCRNGDPCFKMRKDEIWRVIEPFATGKQEIPILKGTGIFDQNGQCTLPKEVFSGMAGFQIKQMLDNPQMFATLMEIHYGKNWGEKCHPALAQRMQKLMEEDARTFAEMTGIEQSTEVELKSLHRQQSKVDRLGARLRSRYPEISAKYKKKFGENAFSRVEFGATEKSDFYKECGQDPDFKKWLLEAESLALDESRYREVQDIKRNLDLAKRPRPQSPGKQLAKTALSLLGRWALVQGAHYLGRELRDTNISEAKGAPLLAEENSKLTLAQQKANIALATGGIVVAGAGVVVQVGSALSTKFATTQVAKVGAKALPVVGTVLGVGWAGYRLAKGDFTGAGLELASAGCDAVILIPGAQPLAPVASAAGLSIDVGLAIRDGMQKDGIYTFGMLDEKGNPVVVKDEKGNDAQARGLTIEFKNNEKNGSAIWYGVNKNGKQYVSAIGEYKDDKKCGLWVRYKNNGRPYMVAEYDDDKLKSFQQTDRYGHLVARLKNGKYEEYWTDAKGNATGQLKRVSYVDENRNPTGNWMDFDSKGRLRSLTKYDRNGSGLCVVFETDVRGDVVSDESGNPKVKFEGLIDSATRRCISRDHLPHWHSICERFLHNKQSELPGQPISPIIIPSAQIYNQHDLDASSNSSCNRPPVLNVDVSKSAASLGIPTFINDPIENSPTLENEESLDLESALESAKKEGMANSVPSEEIGLPVGVSVDPVNAPDDPDSERVTIVTKDGNFYEYEDGTYVHSGVLKEVDGQQVYYFRDGSIRTNIGPAVQLGGPSSEKKGLSVPSSSANGNEVARLVDNLKKQGIIPENSPVNCQYNPKTGKFSVLVGNESGTYSGLMGTYKGGNLEDFNAMTEDDCKREYAKMQSAYVEMQKNNSSGPQETQKVGKPAQNTDRKKTEKTEEKSNVIKGDKQKKTNKTEAPMKAAMTQASKEGAEKLTTMDKKENMLASATSKYKKNSAEI